MTKNEFIETLSTTEGVSYEKKLECINFFIKNYPVEIQNPLGKKEWTKLSIGYLTGGSDNAVRYAFVKLVERKVELKEFKGLKL